MILSITHRGTGLIQTGLMTGFAFFPFVTSLSYPAALAQITEMGFGAAPILFAAKFAVVWPVMFHLFNGFRHLVRFYINSRTFMSKLPFLMFDRSATSFIVHVFYFRVGIWAGDSKLWTCIKQDMEFRHFLF